MKNLITKYFKSLLKYLLRVFLTAMLLLFYINCISQTIDSITLSNRVKNLEDYRLNLDKLYQLNVAKLDSSIDNRIASKVQDVTEAQKTLSLIIWIGIPGTLIGLVVVWFTATNYARKFVISKIAKIVEDKRGEIVKLIETQEYDSRLRKNKKLLVLSPDEESEIQIKNLLGKLHFSEITYRPVNEFKRFKDYDLVIFNDNYSNFSEDLMSEFIENAEEDPTFVQGVSRSKRIE